MLNDVIYRLRSIFSGRTRTVNQIDLLLDQDKLPDAVLLAEQALEKYGRQPELVVSYAKIHARTGKAAEVLKVLNAIPVTSSTSTSVLFDSASMLFLAGDAESADRIFQYLMRERKHWLSALWIAQRDSRTQSHDSAVEAFSTVFAFGGKATWDLVIQSIQGCSDHVVQACSERLEGVKFSQPAKHHYFKMLSLLDARRGRSESSLKNIRRATASYFSSYDCRLRLDTNCPPLKPKFLIIGAMKCGTSTLYDLINQHPLFIPPMEKEIQFFQFPNLNDQWYLEHFPRIDNADGSFTGDASPGYYHFDVQNRIRNLLPDVKILFINRDPAERAISHIKHNNRHGISTDDIDAALTQIDHLEQRIADDPENAERTVSEMTFNNRETNHYLLLGLYDLHLRRWKRVFGSHQILSVRLEDLQSSPQTVMDKVFQFLEVPAASVRLSWVNKGNYSKRDTKTLEVITRLRRFYDTIQELTSNNPYLTISSQVRSDLKND